MVKAWMHSGWLGRFCGLRCPLCEQSGQAGVLCELCRSWLEPLSDPCPGCGAPHTLTTYCGRCQKNPPPWQQLQVAWPLTGASRFLIHQMKYHQDNASLRALAEAWWLQQSGRLNLAMDALVPVPLHRRRLDERGFNQAHWLATQWSRRSGIPLWLGARKVRPTPKLEGLNRRQRKAALAGVFAVDKPVPARLVMVDDVLTTGATAAELARQLTAAGARHLDLWTLARTPLGD